jgi:hypothetical protein
VLASLPLGVRYEGFDLSEAYIAQARRRWKDRGTFHCLGLEYLASVSGPIREEEESAVEAVRVLYARTGGQGTFWVALTKVLEASLDGTTRQTRPARRKTRR